MAQDGIAPNAISYNTLVNAHARVGDPDGVARVLEGMTAAGLAPDVVTWTLMLQACANAWPQRAGAAERVLRRMAGSGVEPNGLTRKALKCAVGYKRGNELLAELGLRGERGRGGPGAPAGKA